MRIRAKIMQQRRAYAAHQSWPWFRAGYITALNDIERTGLQPVTDATKREAADRALWAWVDEPIALSREEPNA